MPSEWPLAQVLPSLDRPTPPRTVGQRSEADLDGPHGVGAKARHGLDRPRPAQVQSRLEIGCGTAEALDDADLVDRNDRKASRKPDHERHRCQS